MLGVRWSAHLYTAKIHGQSTRVLTGLAQEKALPLVDGVSFGLQHVYFYKYLQITCLHSPHVVYQMVFT